MNTSIKQKKCKTCEEKFVPFRIFDKHYSYKCKVKEKGYKEKVRKPIKKVSSKRKTEIGIYTKVRAEYLNKHKLCERCGNSATEIHHKNGRENDKLNDNINFMATCRSCHTWIHLNPEEARQNNFLI